MWYTIIPFWLLSLAIVSAAISYYVKRTGRSDIITAMYVLYIALSQILAAKIVAFGSYTAPAAVVIFPFTFQLTDSMNEHFGRKETHRMIVIAFISQVLMVLFIYFGNALEPAGFWWIDNDQWLMIFSQTFSITAASWISFLVNENLDALIYDWIRKKTQGKQLWIRNVFSDIPTLALDSFIFVTLAFGVFSHEMSWPLVWATILGQLATKYFFGLIDTPFIYLERWVYEKTPLPREAE